MNRPAKPDFGVRTHLAARFATHPRQTAMVLVASLICSVLSLASMVFVMQVMNRYVPFGLDVTLIALTTGMLVVVVVEWGFRDARHRIITDIVEAPDRELAESAFTALIRGRLGPLNRMPPAARIGVLRGIDLIERAYSPANLAALFDLPFMAVTLFALTLISPWLMLITMGFVILSMLMSLASRHAIRAAAKESGEADSKMQITLDNLAESQDAVRAFNQAPATLSRWRALRDRVLDARRRTAEPQNRIQSLTTSLGLLQSTAVIAVGAVLAVKGDISMGALIGANMMAGRALSPATRLFSMLETLARAHVALERVDILARMPKENSDGFLPKSFKGAIEFVDITGGYAGSTGPLFEHLSFRLEPGGALVVTGSNGSGKTSLMRMVAGLMETARGSILVDGVDLRQISLDWWRRQLVYVPQEPVFLDGTIAEIIRANNPELDQAGMDKMVADAGLKTWLDNLAQGTETPVVQGGRLLPVGLRRRLALARALAAGGRLVLLDEPMDGLDREGRQAFAAIIDRLYKNGCTFIVCSHNPDVLQSQRIVVDLTSKPVPTVTNRAAPVRRKRVEEAAS